MAYAYTNTIPGLVSTIRQLRSVFPATVNADTLKKWGIAPNNETYVIHVLRFLGIIDDEGKKQQDAAKAFVLHDDAAFAEAFEKLVRTAYAGLFELYGEDGWSLSKERLIGFFRAEDHTSATVGTRQATTFQALAGIAGRGPRASDTVRSVAQAESKTTARRGSKRRKATEGIKPTAPQQLSSEIPATLNLGNPVTLTVRIEINLPVTDEQDVYDKIFKSIRANFINA